MSLSPIVLFCYNRVLHLQQTVNALLLNEEAAKSDLIIYSDGAKAEKDEEEVKSVRTYIHQIVGFASVKIVERPFNFGLAKSIIEGVTEVVNQYGKIIVLEDDIEAGPYFLRFMNDALTRYEDNTDVACVCAYLYPIKKKVPNVFFIYGADCAAWGTWKDQWVLLEPDGQKILETIERQGSSWRFEFDGSYPYIQMLKDQISGKNNSWAIRWYGSAFIHNKLTLYPGKSMVRNIGWDSSGVNCEAVDTFDVELCREPISLDGIKVMHSKHGYRAFKDFFISFHGWSDFKRLRKRFKMRLKYFFNNKYCY